MATSAFLSRLLLVSTLGLLAGCAGIPRAGPAEMAITAKSADLAGFTLVEVTAENVANYRVSASNDSAGTGGIPGAPRVSLSPGDVINVRIAESKEGGLFAPLATGGTSFANVRVDYKGNISLPYAGQLKVEGLDPNAVGEQIKAKLNGVTFQPQVYVELVSDRGSSVLVAGDVKAPGRFSMMDGPMTLIDAVNRAGGPVRAPHQEDVIVRRGGKVMRVSYAKILDGRNAQLRAGDEVLLEPNLKVFNALGAVTKTGQVEFTKPNLTLLDALSQVGGLDNANSSNRGVFVFRLREPKAWLDGSNKWQQGPAIFQFDMSVPETMFLAQAFGMRPDDTIYVTNAPSVEWLRSLAPIATTLSAMKSAYSLGKTASGL